MRWSVAAIIEEAMNLLVKKILEMSKELQHLPKNEDQFIKVDTSPPSEVKKNDCCQWRKEEDR